MPIEKIKGSRTAVYSASMSDDYTRMYAKDPDDAPRTVITGTALSMMPNRVSWYFDLQGPSVHVDTACSSSMIALDLACQSLHGGDASMVGSWDRRRDSKLMMCTGAGDLNQSSPGT